MIFSANFPHHSHKKEKLKRPSSPSHTEKAVIIAFISILIYSIDLIPLVFKSDFPYSTYAIIH